MSRIDIAKEKILKDHYTKLLTKTKLQFTNTNESILEEEYDDEDDITKKEVADFTNNIFRLLKSP